MPTMSPVREFLAKRNGFAPAADLSISDFQEKVHQYSVTGRLTFMPWLDRFTKETSEMRAAYREMLRQPVVKASLLGKIYSVSSLELSVTPVSDDARDEQIAEFCARAYTQEMIGGVPATAETILLSGLIDGRSISEKVWQPEPKDRGIWAGKRFYRELKDKEHARLKVDEFGNVEAVVSNYSSKDGPWDPADFVIFQNLQLFKGPGMSDLRAAYGKAWMLDTTEKLRMIHLEKFVSPYVAASYSDVNDKPRLEEALAQMTARSWITFPDTVKLQAMQLATRGEAEYQQAVKDLKEDIALAVSGAFLQMLTASGAGDMRGNAQTQKGTAELFVWRLAEVLCTLYNTQLTPALVDLNFSVADYPTVSLGGVNYGQMLQAIQLEEIAQRMGQKLSRKANAKKYSLALAATPDDELTPPSAQPQFPGPFGFSDQHDQHDHCGGKGGTMGPCPTGITEKKKVADELLKGKKPIGATVWGINDRPDFMVKAIGNVIPDDLLPAIGNVPDGGYVTMDNSWDKPNQFTLVGRGAGTESKRTVFNDAAGKLVVYNDKFMIDDDSPHKGKGVELFRDQVAAMREAGVDRIETHAAGNPKDKNFNGYYTWPRMGYDGTMQDKSIAKLPKALREQLGDKKNVQALFVLPGGKEAWKKYGSDIYDATFDLNEGSESLRVLADYLQERKLRGGSFADFLGRSFAFSSNEAMVAEIQQLRDKLRQQVANGKQPDAVDQDRLAELIRQTGQVDDIGELDRMSRQTLGHSDFSEKDIALGGPDGKKAELLLSRAQSEGAKLLSDLAGAAVKRLLASDGPSRTKRLFSDDELLQLADQLAATNGTAELLGRARIAERAAEAEKRQGGKFSEEPTTFRAFDETGPLRPMPPRAALDYFRGLYPSLGVDPERWGPLLERSSFTLALATDETLLTKIQDLIAERLETGEGIGTAPVEIDALLDEAGVGPRSAGYSENVFRTNMMSSYSAGSQREISASAEIFPVWRSSNPDDGRSRPDHAARNGKFFPVTATFEEVRGMEDKDVMQCRCAQIPIDKWEWAELQAAGARLETEW